MSDKELYDAIKGKQDWKRRAEEMEAARDRVLEALEEEYDGLMTRGEQHRKALSIKFAIDIVRREMGGGKCIT